MFDFEFDLNVAGIAFILWLIMVFAIVFLPKIMGATEYPLSYKILIPAALLPISYFIVMYQSNR